MAPGPTGADLINALRGSIYAGVAEREGAGALWQRIRSDLGLPNEGPTGVNLQTFNAIWHEAVSYRNAGEAFAKAAGQLESTGIDQTINSRMVATAAYARPLEERNNAPIWQVNFHMEMTDEAGNPDSGYFTVIHRGTLPPTVEALQDSVNFDAEQMAGRYGKAFVSASAITILAV